MQIDRFYDEVNGVHYNDTHLLYDRELKQYFDKLQVVGFHSDWHNEGCAYKHMCMVHDEMLKKVNELKIIGLERKVLLVSAFFHDIGKATSAELKEDGNYTFPNHAIIGEHIMRTLLWDEDFEFRECVCFFVRNHMKPYYVKEETNIDKFIYKLAYSVPFKPYICSIKNLIMLKECDCLGTIRVKEDDDAERLTMLKNRAKELNLYENSLAINNINKWQLFNFLHTSAETLEEVEAKEIEDGKNVYILCGLMGSGKSTLAKTDEIMKNLPIVSNDLIRIEFGIMGDVNEKKTGSRKQESLVSQTCLNRVKDFCDKKIPFVLDNMNLTTKRRNELVNIIWQKGMIPNIIYVEAPTFQDNVNRRENNIKANIIREASNRASLPNLYEAVNVEYFKQKR